MNLGLEARKAKEAEGGMEEHCGSPVAATVSGQVFGSNSEYAVELFEIVSINYKGGNCRNTDSYFHGMRPGAIH